MNDSHHNSGTSAGRTSTFLLLGIVLLPLLYVLSVGPVAVLARNSLLGPEEGPLYQSLVVFYTPLEWCVQYEIPVVAPTLEWYVNLWIW
ncbi:MAG: hypothetical protein KDA79_05185 [Planctomycetaceae bacterium]|nr:hypothetical protein [Planctomycetaceae bacterium]